jgi:AcrR family transcriptional regulator
MSDTMRKLPRQARSQRRVEQILDAAEAEFADAGYDNATTNAIAARADVPIGSLYQYFPNKEALLAGVVERYTQQMRNLFGQFLSADAVEGLPISEVIVRMVQGLAAFETQHAGFRTVFLSTGAEAQVIHHEIVGRVEALMLHRFPALPADNRQMAAVISVGIVKGLMILTQPPYELPVWDEAQAALLAYLRSVLLRAGIEPPPDLQ